MDKTVRYAIGTKKLLEIISPLMPVYLWGTVEETVKRQYMYTDQTELMQLLTIGLAMQHFRQGFPDYTDSFEAITYMRLICVSCGVISERDKDVAELYSYCIDPAYDIIRQYGSKADSAAHTNDDKEKVEFDDGVTSDTHTSNQPPQNKEYMTEAETLSEEIFKSEFGRAPTDNDRDAMIALLVKADSDIQYRQDDGKNDTRMLMLCKLALFADHLSTAYNEKCVADRFSILIELRLTSHISDWNKSHPDQPITINDVFIQKHQWAQNAISGKFTRETVGKMGIFANHCMTPQECIQFHNENLKDLSRESIEKALNVRKFIRGG
jgi:hypothetical protein